MQKRIRSSDDFRIRSAIHLMEGGRGVCVLYIYMYVVVVLTFIMSGTRTLNTSQLQDTRAQEISHYSHKKHSNQTSFFKAIPFSVSQVQLIGARPANKWPTSDIDGKADDSHHVIAYWNLLKGAAPHERTTKGPNCMHKSKTTIYYDDY